MTDTNLELARRFLSRHPLIDAHNDLPWVIRTDSAACGNVGAFGLARRLKKGDTDIPRLREGGVSGQVFAAFLPSDIPRPATVTLEQIDLIASMLAQHADDFHPVLCAADFAIARRRGKIGVLTSVEGTVGLEGSLAPLRMWRALGVRLVTLCHNRSLPWIDSATDAPRAGGLSEFGRSLIAEMNRLGMIVDLSHVSAEAQHRVLDVAEAPLVLSHSNARTLCPHPRNAPDDILDRVAASQGLVMATFVPSFVSAPLLAWEKPFRNRYGESTLSDEARRTLSDELSRTKGAAPKATISGLADHIDYLHARIGEDHIGIGSDYYGGPTIQGLEHVGRFPHLFAELIRRGWTERRLKKLAGGNFLRVFRAVESAAAKTAS